jgi:WD40 repeat protein
MGQLRGRRVIVSGGAQDAKVMVTDAVTGEPVGDPLIGGVERIMAVALEHDLIASAGADQLVRLWNVKRGQTTRAVHRDLVNALAAGRLGDQDVVVSAGDDGTVRTWSAHDGLEYAPPIRGAGRFTAVAIGRTRGRPVVLCGCADAFVYVVDPLAAELMLEPLGGHEGGINGVAFCPLEIGGMIVTAGCDDGTLQRWDADTGRPVGEPLYGHRSEIRSVHIGLVEGRPMIASCAENGLTLRWDAASGAQLDPPLRGHARGVTAVCFGNVDDRVILLTGGEDGAIRVWDAASGEPCGRPLIGHTGPVTGLACPRNRPLIVSSSDDLTIRTWDARTGEALDVLSTFDAATAVTLSADGLVHFAAGRAVACAVCDR